MRISPQFLFYGLLVPKRVSKKLLRNEALRITEINFLKNSTTEGKKTARQLDNVAEHYSNVTLTRKQVVELMKEVMKSGFDLRNLNEIFLKAPLPEFRATVKNGRRNVEVIFTRPDLTSMDVDGGTADCFLDAHYSYSRIRKNSIRVSRLSMSSLRAFQLYTDPMNPGININFYQDLGVRLYTLYIAVQFALLCTNDALTVTNTRYRYLISSDKKSKYHKVIMHDFTLSSTKFDSPVLARNISKEFEYSRRFLSKKGWRENYRAFYDSPGELNPGCI